MNPLAYTVPAASNPTGPGRPAHLPWEGTTAMTGNLHRIRWTVRATLTLGVAASVAANILHARPNPISQTIAAWPPVALLVTVELISRVPATSRWRSAIRLSATAGIAGIAAWVSYWHMASVVARYGETGPSPYLMPFSVDGLIVVASICLVELGTRIAATNPIVHPGTARDDHDEDQADVQPPAQDPTPADAEVIPAEPVQAPTHLIPAARFAATNYQATTGTPITPAQLAGRISVTEPVAAALLAILNPAAGTRINGTPVQVVNQ